MTLSSNINILTIVFVYFVQSNSKSIESTLDSSANIHTYNADTHYSDTSDEQESVEELIKRLFVTNSSFTPREGTVGTNFQPGKSIPKPTLTQATTNENVTTSYYTTYVENYPDFSFIAPKLKKFQGFMLKDSISIGIDTNTLIEPDAYRYRPLCNTEIEIITPRAIKNKENRQVRVVNYPEYQQSIRAETCRNRNNACSYAENFPNNLMPICKQNYIFRQILVMTDSDDPDIVLEDIPIPSCCVCVLKDMTLVQ